MSQSQLADLMDVSGASVSAWERGIAFPEIDRLSLLRDALKQPLDYLVCGDPHESTERVSEAKAAYVSESRQLEAAILDQLRDMTPRRLRGLLAFLTSEDSC